MDTLPVVTFGKYKGQPVTALLADTKYLEWCKQQEFFKNQTTIYNICVNQTIQTGQSKTPEHNKLQNLFLKRKFLEDITNYLTGFDKTLGELEKLYCTEEYKKYFGDQRFDADTLTLKYKPVFEAEFNWDVILTITCFSNYILCNQKLVPSVANDFNYVCDAIKRDIPLLRGPYFAVSGSRGSFYSEIKSTVDLSIEVDVVCCIEIKPLLGDDYPNVLRKMNTQIKLTKSNEKRQRRLCSMWILLIGEFSSSVTTKEELIVIFRQSGIKIVFVGDISNGLQSKPLEENSEKIKRLEEENRQLKEKIKQLELLQSK
jgi:hypothetical protein